MNWEQIEGRWNEFKGKIKTKWNKLTDDDLDAMRGKRTELLGRLQQRYGYKKDEAERHIDEWIHSVDTKPEDKKPRSTH
jgi:uncharacterized protein YjbJ (UPF0337 family)